MEIELTKGVVALIDDCDFELVSSRKWYASYWISKSGPIYYAATNNKYKSRPKITYMHRLIMGSVEMSDLYVDHIDGNTLNNRRSNLRYVTPAQNIMNSKKSINRSSIYKGVVWCKTYERWWAGIGFNKSLINIGLFDVEIEAAVAYDKKAKELFGEYARLNFV